MKKHLTKIMLMLLVAGVALAIVGYINGAQLWVYADLSGVHIQQPVQDTSYDLVLQNYDNIQVNVDYATVQILPSEDDEIHIDATARPCTYEAKDDALVISSSYFGGDWAFINMNMSFLRPTSAKITVRLPKKEWKSLSVTSSMGSIDIKDTKVGALDLICLFGDIYMDNIQGKMQIEMQNGSLYADKLTGESFQYENSFGSANVQNATVDLVKMSSKNGNIHLNNIQMKSLVLENYFGWMHGENINGDKMTATSRNGDVTLVANLKDIAITNQFGDVALDLSEKGDNYGYSFTTAFGGVYVNGQHQENRAQNLSKSAKRINIENKNGDIRVNFKNE